jgi:hypothetical protein
MKNLSEKSGFFCFSTSNYTTSTSNSVTSTSNKVLEFQKKFKKIQFLHQVSTEAEPAEESRRFFALEKSDDRIKKEGIELTEGDSGSEIGFLHMNAAHPTYLKEEGNVSELRHQEG